MWCHIFTYPIKLNISTKNTAAKILPWKLYCDFSWSLQCNHVREFCIKFLIMATLNVHTTIRGDFLNFSREYKLGRKSPLNVFVNFFNQHVMAIFLQSQSVLHKRSFKNRKLHSRHYHSWLSWNIYELAPPCPIYALASPVCLPLLGLITDFLKNKINPVESQIDITKDKVQEFMWSYFVISSFACHRVT